MAQTQATALVIDQLYRIRLTTMKYKHRLKAVLEFITIVHFLNYTTRTIRRALIRIYETTHEQHWKDIYSHIKLHYL